MEISSPGADVCRAAFRGRLDHDGAAALWRRAVRETSARAAPRLVLDTAGLDYLDSAGLSLLAELVRRQQARNAQWELCGLRPEWQGFWDFCRPDHTSAPPAEPARRWRLLLPEQVGAAAVGLVRDTVRLVAYVGELAAVTVGVARHPGRLRFRDVLWVVETAGVNALPIVALIGLLLGLILGFQSAVALKQFGAELFVANLVSLSLLRELGPLITAIVLAARSGSAFAAELGTMKVNEELDALTTMGLDPVRFLVVPRVLGAVLITPLLTVFANLCGLVGAALVMLSLDFPLVTYVHQVLSAVRLKDLNGGLFKAVVFGLLVAAIGCQRGLETGTGASAVGASTTRAVVSGIVLIALADGVFSVLFFQLGW